MNLELSLIIESVRRWCIDVQCKYSDILESEIIADERRFYRAIFSLEECMAEAVVA